MNNVADKKSIQKLLKLIQKTDIEEICVSENDAELVIPDVFIPPKTYTPVKSKNIGVFQLAAKIEVGSSIKAGQVVGQVLAMGVKNDVTAEDAGKVAEILTEDGAVVDYGHAVLNLA